MSDPAATGADAADDLAGAGDDAAAGTVTGVTALDDEDGLDEDGGGPGDDAAAGAAT